MDPDKLLAQRNRIAPFEYQVSIRYQEERKFVEVILPHRFLLTSEQDNSIPKRISAEKLYDVAKRLIAYYGYNRPIQIARQEANGGEFNSVQLAVGIVQYLKEERPTAKKILLDVPDLSDKSIDLVVKRA